MTFPPARLLSAALLAASLLVGAPGGTSAQYEACRGLAARDVSGAFTLIGRNAPRISSDWAGEQIPRIKNRERRLLLLKDRHTVKKVFDGSWRPGRVRIVCGPCRDEPGLMGRSLGRRTVLVCYQQHVAMRTGFCELVDTIVHEAVHQIALPTGSTHTHSVAGRDDDPIYRFGWAAGELCRSGGWERPLAASTPSAPGSGEP